MLSLQRPVVGLPLGRFICEVVWTELEKLKNYLQHIIVLL